MYLLHMPPPALLSREGLGSSLGIDTSLLGAVIAAVAEVLVFCVTFKCPLRRVGLVATYGDARISPVVVLHMLAIGNGGLVTSPACYQRTVMVTYSRADFWLNVTPLHLAQRNRPRSKSC